MSNPRVRLSVRDRSFVNIITAVGLLAIMLFAILSVNAWYDGMLEGAIPMFAISIETVSSLVFEQWGVLVVILGLVLFATMLGGVFIAQEEDEE